MLDELQSHHFLPWWTMMRKVVIGVMFWGAVYDQYQRSVAVTSWMYKVTFLQDEASSAAPPPPLIDSSSFSDHQNVAIGTTTTKPNAPPDGNQGNPPQGIDNDDDNDDNDWKLQFQGRIHIPIYTAAMARDAVQPQWGFCHYRQRIPPSSIRLLDDDSDPSGNSSSSTTTTNNKKGHNNSHNSVKFAFVHIFKTAGSTLREFFYLYSHHCALGWMVLISCTNSRASSSSSRMSMRPNTTTTTSPSSSSSSVKDHNTMDRYRNPYWEICILKKLLQRDGSFLNLTDLLLTQQQLEKEEDEQQLLLLLPLLDHSNQSSSSYNKAKKKKTNKKRVYPALVGESVDILGGHFKIGMADDLVQPLYSSTSSWQLPTFLDKKERMASIHSDTTPLWNKSTHWSSSSFSSSSSPPPPYHSKIRHITFVRQPLPKYVSGKVFHHKEIQSQEEIIALIKHEVTHARQAGEYWMRVSNYLLTPLQQQELQQQQQAATTTSHRSSTSPMSSDEYKTQLILKNLVHYNVIVGIVEDMSQSMTILQNILDPDQKMTRLFTKYGGVGGGGGGGRRRTSLSNTTTTATLEVHQEDAWNNTTTHLVQHNTPMDTNSTTIGIDKSSSSSRRHVVNKSRFSTSSILKELQTTDPAFFQEFVEYVKYEQFLYDFAWNMHQQQYQAAILLSP
jgi:hypothetical protein